MAEESEAKPIPALPMASRLSDHRAKADFARKLNISPQRLNGWIKRGRLPGEWLPEVALGLGITMESYLSEGGRLPDGYKIASGSIATLQLVKDFEWLPPLFQEHVCQYVSKFRKQLEKLSADIRAAVKAPEMNNPDSYATWENTIGALASKFPNRDPNNGATDSC